MPAFYEYKCPECGQRYETTKHRGDRLYTCCVTCGKWESMRRVFSFSLERPMQEHWNATVNKPIRDNKQFDRELRRMSDEASEYAGIEQRYERIDAEDTRALGVTAEGLDATNRVRVQNGQRPINIDKL